VIPQYKELLDITVTAGLVQQPDKIVVRFALTIYPYSLNTGPDKLPNFYRSYIDGQNEF
jgi:hypothetical protein